MQKRAKKVRHMLPGLTSNLQSSFCFVQDRFYVNVLGKFQKLTPPEILAKMSYPHICRDRGVFLKINIIKAPVVGEVGTHQYNIASLKLFDAVTNELCALTFIEMDQFDLGMIVP